MRIEGWSIEAFGVFRDFSMRSFGPKLNVLLGPNEAGKSTLLEFMRGALFGFPMKRGKPLAYSAPAGLRHGGRLFLSTELGPVAVERFAGKDNPVRVLFADGRVGSDAELHLLLRQSDDSLFRNIFAISLSELQDFSTLSESGVRDKIFSAGVAGAGRSARAVIEHLNESADGLFKPRANGGAINSLLIRLEDLRLRLTAARSDCERYRTLLEEDQKLRSLLSIGQKLTASLKLDDLLPIIFSDVREIISCDYAIVVLLEQDGKPIPGIAPAAIQEGKHTGRNISRTLQDRPREPFHYVDKGMLATIGRLAAVAQEVAHRHPEAGAFAPEEETGVFFFEDFQSLVGTIAAERLRLKLCSDL